VVSSLPLPVEVNCFQSKSGKCRGKAPLCEEPSIVLVGFHSHPLGGFNGFNHFEKYESQWEGLSHLLRKIKNV